MSSSASRSGLAWPDDARAVFGILGLVKDDTAALLSSFYLPKSPIKYRPSACRVFSWALRTEARDLSARIAPRPAAVGWPGQIMRAPFSACCGWSRTTQPRSSIRERAWLRPWLV